MAAEAGDLEALKGLADDPQLVQIKDSSGLTIMHKAVIYEYMEMAEYLLQQFPDCVNQQDHVSRAYLNHLLTLQMLHM